MLRYIEGGGEWGKGSRFEELMNEYNDKIDMMMMSEKNFLCENDKSVIFLK